MWRQIGWIGMLLLTLVVSEAWSGEKNWGNQTELSYVESDGNSEVTTFAGKNILTVEQGEQLVYTWDVDALYGESNGQRNSERYSTQLRGDYLFTQRCYCALMAGWHKDSFAGIDNQYHAGGAGGYKLLIGPKNLWVAEAGLDYVGDEYTDNTERDYARGRAFTEYQYLFTEKNRFLQSVEYLHDFDESDNYNINTVTSVTSALSDSLSLKASYEIHYDNEPVPITLDDTDTLLTVALVINI